MDFCVITNGYPNKNNIYNNGFIHSRVREYKTKGLSGYVILLNDKENYTYIYEDIHVHVATKRHAIELLTDTNPSKILIHFITRDMFEVVKLANRIQETIIWIHGTEAISWKRRTFNMSLNPLRAVSFLKYVIFNKLQMNYLKKIIIEHGSSLTFIFVSNWMMQAMIKDLKLEDFTARYFIIPNFVDPRIFKYNQKNEDVMLNVLSIRSYNSRKYATDIVAKTIIRFSKRPEFKEFTFNIYGNGKFHKKDTKKIKKYANVHIYNYFLEQKDIPDIHRKNGIMLIPTRQDAQGVSMCEAVSSGLIPITSNNTAIPEFIEDDYGYLCSSIDDYVKSLLAIYNNISKYHQMSITGSETMQEICGDSAIIKEIKIITEGE